MEDNEGALCYELFHKPTKLTPCGHIFCDPCLRRLAKAHLVSTKKCPICRTPIVDCQEDKTTSEAVNNIYQEDDFDAREIKEQKSGTYNYPLPTKYRFQLSHIPVIVYDYLMFIKDEPLTSFLCFILILVVLIFAYFMVLHYIPLVCFFWWYLLSSCYNYLQTILFEFDFRLYHFHPPEGVTFSLMGYTYTWRQPCWW